MRGGEKYVVDFTREGQGLVIRQGGWIKHPGEREEHRPSHRNPKCLGCWGKYVDLALACISSPLLASPASSVLLSLVIINLSIHQLKAWTGVPVLAQH